MTLLIENIIIFTFSLLNNASYKIPLTEKIKSHELGSGLIAYYTKYFCFFYVMFFVDTY